tara:strand:- start:147 stop:353 length:207 start_codon:yes stop_codon:yes gene_type:complete
MDNDLDILKELWKINEDLELINRTLLANFSHGNSQPNKANDSYLEKLSNCVEFSAGYPQSYRLRIEKV